MSDQELAERINELVTPTTTDVRRTKRAILQLLADRAPHFAAHLVGAAATEVDAPRQLSQLELHFDGPADPALITADAPAIAYVRGRIAAMRALAELAVSGIVIPAASPENSGEDRHDPLLFSDQVARMGIRHARGGFGVSMSLRRPALEQAYMLAEPDEWRWYLDPDLFREEIGDDVLTERAQRALTEALAAFRRRLYLACASLLGVVSEAVWYAAAESLAGPTDRLRKDIDEGKTARLQVGVAQLFRELRVGEPTLPDELLAHAGVLRAIRNYGVHPTEVRDDLERYFTEEACGLLILETHHYLTKLASAAASARDV